MALPDLPRPRSKASVILAYAICPIMLALSCYGFWEWLQLPLQKNLAGLAELFYLMCLVVMPLVLFLFLSVTAAQRLEYQRLSTSHQARIDRMQKRLNEQEDFLHSMTDYNPQAISIFDKSNNFWFVNLSAAHNIGQDARDVIGKSLNKVYGHDVSRKMEVRLNAVRDSGKAIDALDELTGPHGERRFIQTHYKTVSAFNDFAGGVMVVEEDITNLILERERRETMFRQVIATLVAVVDRRDPYAAGHSARVGQLSRAIAEEMTLTEQQIEAAEIAGSLMNFGKVLVSRSILTKSGPLTANELQRVREGILSSSEILSLIDFSGPVVSTLQQVLERYDGRGAPNGLSGDSILITARIVAVANAFVALVSARAHRPSIPMRDAVQSLMGEADTAYDRRVVMALGNFIENRAGKLEWIEAKKLS